MFACGLDILEAACVTASLSACIVQPNIPDLVLVKGSSIEIYRLHQDVNHMGFISSNF